VISTQLGYITHHISNVVLSMIDEDWWEVYFFLLDINFLVLKLIKISSGTCFVGLFLQGFVGDFFEVQLTTDSDYEAELVAQ